MPSLSLRRTKLPRGSHRSVSRGATSIAQKSKRPVGQAILRDDASSAPCELSSPWFSVVLRGAPGPSVLKPPRELGGLQGAPFNPTAFLTPPYSRTVIPPPGRSCTAP